MQTDLSLVATTDRRLDTRQLQVEFDDGARSARLQHGILITILGLDDDELIRSIQSSAQTRRGGSGRDQRWLLEYFGMKAQPHGNAIGDAGHEHAIPTMQ
jgi:hypothetical protein